MIQNTWHEDVEFVALRDPYWSRRLRQLVLSQDSRYHIDTSCTKLHNQGSPAGEVCTLDLNRKASKSEKGRDNRDELPSKEDGPAFLSLVFR